MVFSFYNYMPISYNILFNNKNVWEIQESDDGQSVTCYHRKASKFNTFRYQIDEIKNLSGTELLFGYDDWKALKGDMFHPADHNEESLPIIYYAIYVLNYPIMEKVRKTKYIFYK